MSTLWGIAEHIALSLADLVLEYWFRSRIRHRQLYRRRPAKPPHRLVANISQPAAYQFQSEILQGMSAQLDRIEVRLLVEDVLDAIRQRLRVRGLHERA